MDEAPIGGTCDPAFAAVREAFAESFAARGEVGASVTVIVDGVEVVDLHGGWADEARTQPWAPSTLVNFYSVGKALVALLALQLVDEGRLDLDDPVASVWPEFAAAGKGAITVREALCHRGAVPGIHERMTNDDLWSWERMTAALAATAPWWEPGTRHGYHTNTYGFLIGEIVRRVSGQRPGERLRGIAEALEADVWFGLPASEHGRCAEVIWAPGDLSSYLTTDGKEGDELMEMTSYVNPPGLSSIGVVNTPEWRSAEVPSTNGHGTARGVARVYAALLEPDRLLSPEILAEATRAQSTGPCPMLHDEMSFGLGFQPTTAGRPFGPNPRSFGHFGTGGSLGFADPDAAIAFGYVMNHVIPRWQSTRNRALLDATYASL
jgi:CubicO group peptidase (beta-lactamase class C family)